MDTQLKALKTRMVEASANYASARKAYMELRDAVAKEHHERCSVSRQAYVTNFKSMCKDILDGMSFKQAAMKYQWNPHYNTKVAFSWWLRRGAIDYLSEAEFATVVDSVRKPTRRPHQSPPLPNPKQQTETK